MRLPEPRGPLSRSVRDRLASGDTQSSVLTSTVHPDIRADDEALALWMLFELFYRGFDEVDDDMEWDPDLLRLRGRLERTLEGRLRADFESWTGPATVQALLDHHAQGPGVAGFVRDHATVDDVREILVQKSINHLKEADPHCFVLPRLSAGPKAALAELQYDELGNGHPERVHSQLFADALEAAGLDPSYGAHIDRATTSTLEISNALSMFCLRRRLRHAAMGHLAAFEASSSLPCADIVRGLRRLDLDEAVVRYYDEHVEADAVHELLAMDDICGRMIAEEPEAEREVLFGAFVCLELEARAGNDLLAAMSPA
ncbi:iron-containing redox enzyme family protein [Aeromicrobium sp. CF4.19]|uniref:iron-containing redox enzyme family protein n=1 Tax=Aeromicrobium sp. CF4.19 TaxID=3373082 RepID=UPI003EE58271